MVAVKVSEMTCEELQKLAEERDKDALCELGKRYRFGEKGVNQNLTLAYRMYHKAEKQQAKEAYLALGEMYANGEYFGKNEKIAKEYFALAGKNARQQENCGLEKTVSVVQKDSVAARNIKSETVDLVIKLLEQGENCRMRGDFEGAKQWAAQAFNLTEQAKASGDSWNGKLPQICADIYWLFAYTAFNEQDYAKLEKYAHMPDVIALHPWVAYLVTMGHRICNVGREQLFDDMQSMLKLLNNKNLSKSQLGDMLGALGDLCLMDIRNVSGDKNEQAYEFYKNASDLGNMYAAEQLNKFRKNILGKLIYNG